MIIKYCSLSLVNIYYISFIFITLSIIIAVNGFNFIDRLNGLVLGYSIIILSVFCFFLTVNIHLFLLFVFRLLPVAHLSFCLIFRKRYLYRRWRFIFFRLYNKNILCITICNENILNATEIAFLISYPIVEVIFSVLRRLISQRKVGH